jgi:uroporphyrin-III C-methyltransferase
MSVKVWLVGAGPGDPELLTLKAVRALSQAQVVLIDDLVNEAVLVHCAQARIIHVGKRGGCRSTPQAFIHRLMLRYARQGKCVVRLKGGDPCIFGRGGEEAQWLRERGVDVELVNGITRCDAGDGAHAGWQQSELAGIGPKWHDAGGLHGRGEAERNSRAIARGRNGGGYAGGDD